MTIFSRRRVLANGLLGVGSIALAGCDRLTGSGAVNEILGSAEGLTQSLQRLALGRSLAREFTEADLSPVFRVNGTSQRSEEHTSELQSLMRISYAVFCLKKKKHLKLNQQNRTQYNSTTSHNR